MARSSIFNWTRENSLSLHQLAVQPPAGDRDAIEVEHLLDPKTGGVSMRVSQFRRGVAFTMLQHFIQTCHTARDVAVRGLSLDHPARAPTRDCATPRPRPERVREH